MAVKQYNFNYLLGAMSVKGENVVANFSTGALEIILFKSVPC